MIPFAWAACRCYIWPIAIVGNPGRCGRCGEAPETLVPAPHDGKARAL